MPAVPPGIQTRLRSHRGGEEAAAESRAQEVTEGEALRRRRLFGGGEEGEVEGEEREGRREEGEGAERKSEQI